MIENGSMQKLIIKRFTSVGAFLNEEREESEDILLPKSQIPEGAELGDEVKVMVYRDSKDRLIATSKKPKAEVGQLAHLMVVSQTKIGAFLDWGLDKDIFLPFAETIGGVEKGKSYLVAVYLDKSDRVCASMRVQEYLEDNPPYKGNEIVEGTIYSINKDIGAFVAVEDKYNGLIPRKELLGAYDVGDSIQVRIRSIKEDGKLDLSLRDRGENQMAADARLIYDKLKANGGFLPFNDKSDPKKIAAEFNLSKSAFKRAVGNLYKEKIIAFEKNGIKLI